ncbi:XVIPCD domain-containing protein [Stenotrophomonas sp.]|uniref:XVIPCD domain-containing protein n=1 Tax=Stenotrophomonas sp. TaxID=69392 RepID=UPI0031CFE215
MSGLTKKDIGVLEFYVAEGNRELYWNYLAQLPGNDGYGLLALGVVRNDSLPGRVANSFATMVAEDQVRYFGSKENVDFTERRQETFGQDLIGKDLEERKRMMDAGQPDLALNLPYTSTLKSHDYSFEANHLSVNCWTPRMLLAATERSKGQEAAEQVWKDMLDNSAAGVLRAGKTGVSAHLNMPLLQGHLYVVELGKLEAKAVFQNDAVDPNVIGTRFDYHTYNAQDGSWDHTRGKPPLDITTKETDPAEISKLNEAREVRLEREIKATQFHPDDPYREIKKSPLVVSNQEPDLPGSEGRRMLAMEPGHPDYPLYQQIRQGIVALDEKHGRTPDATSENLAASLTLKARQEGIEHADHVVLSNVTAQHPAGHNIFVVQGDLADPAHLRAGMPTAEAARMPALESMEQLVVVSDQRELARQDEMQALDVETQTQSGPGMRMG